MGTSEFWNPAKGKTAEKAFASVTKEARYEYGNRGYTGSIAEKDNFVVIPLPAGIDPKDRRAVEAAASLFIDVDSRVSDKWGPAGCFDLGGGEYLFFGLASS